jgi:hypothetical protein
MSRGIRHFSRRRVGIGEEESRVEVNMPMEWKCHDSHTMGRDVHYRERERHALAVYPARCHRHHVANVHLFVHVHRLVKDHSEQFNCQHLLFGYTLCIISLLIGRLAVWF